MIVVLEGAPADELDGALTAQFVGMPPSIIGRSQRELSYEGLQLSVIGLSFL